MTDKLRSRVIVLSMMVLFVSVIVMILTTIELEFGEDNDEAGDAGEPVAEAV